MSSYEVRIPNGDADDDIAANQGAISAYADSAGDPGVDTTVTSTAHGITAQMVTRLWNVTISGSTAAQYDGTFVVTRIVDDDNFDIAKVFGTDPGDGSFLVEKIYRLTPWMLTSTVVLKNGESINVDIALREINANNLQDAGINWASVSTGTDDYIKGDSSLLLGLRITGNPTAAVKVDVIQGTRF